MGFRRDKISDEIRDIVASCFHAGKLNDPRLDAVTVTAVKLSSDLQMASVYFTVHDDNINSAMLGLQSASGFLRKQLADQLDIRRVPVLRFFHDESIERAVRIESLLKNI